MCDFTSCASKVVGAAGAIMPKQKEELQMTPPKSNSASRQDADLLVKINAAVKAVNKAEEIATTAKAELVSRSKAVGLLLIEAKKLHPATKDFDAFLKRVNGLKLARAYDCMRIAGGRITEEELKEDARNRKRKSRAYTRARWFAPLRRTC
jgi:hypothetical protein